VLLVPRIPRPDRGYDREKVQMCIRMRQITDGFCKKSASKLRSRIEAVKGGWILSSGSVPILCLWIFGGWIDVKCVKGERKKKSQEVD